MTCQTQTADPDMSIKITHTTPPRHDSPATAAAAADATPLPPPQPSNSPPTKIATPSVPPRRGPSPDMHAQLLPNNHRLGLSDSPPIMRSVVFAGLIVTAAEWAREALATARCLPRPDAVLRWVLCVLVLVALMRAAREAFDRLLEEGEGDDEEEGEGGDVGEEAEEEMRWVIERNRSGPQTAAAAAIWESFEERERERERQRLLAWKWRAL